MQKQGTNLQQSWYGTCVAVEKKVRDYAKGALAPRPEATRICRGSPNTSPPGRQRLCKTRPAKSAKRHQQETMSVCVSLTTTRRALKATWNIYIYI